MIYFCSTSSVTQMLTSINWASLNHRRNITRLQIMYKIIHEIIDLTLPEYIKFSKGITRGHELPYPLQELIHTNSASLL